jgi:hypothetical protein
MKKTELKRTGFKPRQKPMARTGKLKQQSPKAKAEEPAEKVNPIGPVCCIACGRHDNLSRSHILTKHQFKQHKHNPNNLVWLCIWPCHHSWEHNKQEFKRNHPEAWNIKLAAMRKLNRSYYAFFCQKHGGPAPLTD